LASQDRKGSRGFIARPAILAQLERMAADGKLGQPLLLTGPAGAGKENTALEFARRLNCVAPESCTTARPCESCAKALAFQHPDIRWIGPAPAAAGDDDVRALFEAKLADPFHVNPWAASGQILIGDPEHPGPLSVRSLMRFLRLRAFQGHWKVAVVADAQRLNASAANAFLKTLEEPPPDSVIMLLSTGAESLLPTIVSRCRKVPVAPWPEGELADLVADLGGVDRETATALARQSGGDARLALALLGPEARLVAGWAADLFAWIHAGRRGRTAVAADELHRGVAAEDAVPAGATAKSLEAKEPALRRGRAIQLCEMLNLLYSDAVACREAGPQWRPRLAAGATGVREAATRRTTASLLADLVRIEEAKRDIDGNVNIGLAMAVLFEGLIDHAERDQARGRTAAG